MEAIYFQLLREGRLPTPRKVPRRLHQSQPFRRVHQSIWLLSFQESVEEGPKRLIPSPWAHCTFTHPAEVPYEVLDLQELELVSHPSQTHTGDAGTKLELHAPVVLSTKYHILKRASSPYGTKMIKRLIEKSIARQTLGNFYTSQVKQSKATSDFL